MSATLDHRPARIAQVSVQPLLPQHRDERREHGDYQTRVHETGDGDGLALRGLLDGWNGGGLTGNGGLIEGEEDGTEDGSGLFIWIGLEVRMDVDDKRRADGRE